MKLCFSAKINLHAKRVLDVQFQSDNAQQRCATREIDQQIEVASLFVEPLRDRAEDAHTACTLRCCEGQNLLALGSECLRGEHRAILAGLEAPGHACGSQRQSLGPGAYGRWPIPGAASKLGHFRTDKDWAMGRGVHHAAAELASAALGIPAAVLFAMVAED